MSINLNQISSSQFAETQASNINANFTTLKSAVESIPSDGGGSSSDGGSIIRPYINTLPNKWRYDSTFTKLKILCIGNSFLAYPLCALGNVFTLSAANTSIYLLQQAADSSTNMTIDGAFNRISSGSGNTPANAYYTRHFGSGGTTGSSINFRSVVSGSWDAIIFQQRSNYVADYSSYARLSALIEVAKQLCTNADVRIGWHMVWDKNHGKSAPDRENILLNTNLVMDNFDVDFVVPTGTAFENAWANGMTLQLDTSGHPTNAASQWLASATWYQALFSEFIDKDIVTDMTPSVSQSWTTIGGSTLTADVATCTLANKCAKAACNDMWNVTTVS